MKLDPRVTSLGALRLLSSGDGVMYEPRGIDDPSQAKRHAAVEQLCRQAMPVVGLRPAQAGDYAVLDGYDDDGDIVAEYGLSRSAFKFLYRKLGWRKWNANPEPSDS